MGKPINSDIDYHYDYNSNLDRLLNLVDLSEFFEVDGYWEHYLNIFDFFNKLNYLYTNGNWLEKNQET